MVDLKTDGDVREMAEMLDMISDKIPKILNGMMESLYSVDRAKTIGQSVGALYKELMESGIPEDAALKMSMDYMISIKDVSKMTKTD